MARNLLLITRQLRTMGTMFSSCRNFGASPLAFSRRPENIEQSEIEAADPFLSKLQQQTEASYLELLSRKDEVPQTEDEQAERDVEVAHLTLQN